MEKTATCFRGDLLLILIDFRFLEPVESPDHALTCFCATHVIPEGEGAKADLQNYGITHKPLKVLGYGNVKGIDLVYFDQRQTVKELAGKMRDASSFTFVFVGRIVRDKGINELCDASCRL